MISMAEISDACDLFTDDTSLDAQLATILHDPDAMKLKLRDAREDREEVELAIRLRGESIDPRLSSLMEPDN